jgi:hypothetical protein
MTPTLELTPGLIVRIDGHEGRWRVVERCKDAVGRSWWCLQVDGLGNPTKVGGWHATHAECCTPPKPVRVKRHYRRKEKER